ncbi:hypothetical protein C1H46_011087 [Malus baccata]|uniref:RRM domain-containing protein n=1 Tax=Malus baccata TaxID=106549 RepID=A0A540MWW1_MALBA|nr:hypothetical protein C1H46_011087 [Malus baccata]
MVVEARHLNLFPSQLIPNRDMMNPIQGNGNLYKYPDWVRSAVIHQRSDGGGSAIDIYVGNVPFDISSDRLLSAFSAYREIEEGPPGFDKVTGKSKGFAFFVYNAEQGVRAALVEPLKNINGHQVACKLAINNKKSKPGGAQGTPDNSSVRPLQSSMPPGMYQGMPPQTCPYSSFLGGHQQLPVPSGNNFGGARYENNGQEVESKHGCPPTPLSKKRVCCRPPTCKSKE